MCGCIRLYGVKQICLIFITVFFKNQSISGWMPIYFEVVFDFQDFYFLLREWDKGCRRDIEICKNQFLLNAALLIYSLWIQSRERVMGAIKDQFLANIFFCNLKVCWLSHTSTAARKQIDQRHVYSLLIWFKFSYDYCLYGFSVRPLTWKFSHTNYRGQKLLPNGWPQCGSS